MSVVTLDEVKAYLGQHIASNADDSLLVALIASVENRVAEYTGRMFAPDPPLDQHGQDTLPPVSRTVLLRGRPRDWWVQPYPYYDPRTVDIPEAREVDTVTIQGETVSGWELLPHSRWPVYTRLAIFDPSFPRPVTAYPQIVLTGRFGWYPPPESIKDAIKIMVARRYRERDAGYSDMVAFPDGGTVSFFRQFNPTVQATLDNYRRQARLG